MLNTLLSPDKLFALGAKILGVVFCILITLTLASEIVSAPTAVNQLRRGHEATGQRPASDKRLERAARLGGIGHGTISPVLGR